MFYFTLFALVTFFHNLYITLCEVVDRLKPALTQAILAVEIGTGYGDTLLLRSTGREFINQDKLLPRHIACVFVGEGVQSVNIDKIVTIVRWCGAAGIRSISLYDHTGTSRFLCFRPAAGDDKLVLVCQVLFVRAGRPFSTN